MRMLRSLLIVVLLIPVGGISARAHQASLAVLSLTEIQQNRFAMRWDNRPTSSGGDVFVDVAPIWPDTCVASEEVLTCEDAGLSGTLGFEGLGSAQSAAMIKIEYLDGESRAVLLTPSAPTARLMGQYEAGTLSGLLRVGESYARLGVEHILQGVDHLLFVLGLMLIAGAGWRLVKTITAFTVAHTVTLSAVTFGLVGVPEAFVNTMIAFSIVFVGVEIIRKRRGQTSSTLRHPEFVAFGFGLLHGFGFANALVELGLPQNAQLLALAAFNVGVEIGQLCFVLLVLALMMAWRSMAAPTPRLAPEIAAYAIGGLASFWFIARFTLLMGLA